ncbi:MAG TPA: Gfo/Idh/MocA family oxidoreductase [Chloroflexota bacterium]|nr:Gfo/Idh/MocA family oxidoreductase [Chloroflexota bacterium]
MDVLILGLSSIVQRRVRAALQAVPAVQRVDLATRRAKTGVASDWTEGTVFDDFRPALDRSTASLVYVSLVNSEHERWAEAAIASGRHVVVDKPAFLGLRTAERMLDLAAKKRVCLAEAIVYGYHPQMQRVHRIFAEAGCAPSRITATFSFPPLDESNFRYRRALGGGALWDVGPYAASIGRLIFRDAPTAVDCRILTRGGIDKVDTAFAVLATFSGGRSMVGLFGFNTVYRNRVDVLGEHVGVEIDRVFTTPPDSASPLRVTRPHGTSREDGLVGDSFQAFFAHVCERIDRGSWNDLTGALAADARALQQLRDSSGAD